MGNTVTCCVSPDASPKLGRARGGAGGAAAGPERWADAYQAAPSGGGSGSAEADSGDSEPGGGGGPHLQHISDREFPDGERRAAGLPGRRGGERSGGAPSRPPRPFVPAALCPERSGRPWGPGGRGWLQAGRRIGVPSGTSIAAGREEGRVCGNGRRGAGEAEGRDINAGRGNL